MVEMKLEGFFLVQYIRRSGGVRTVKILELLAAGIAIFLFLIVVGKSHRAPFAVVDGHHVFEREFSVLGHTTGEFLDGGVHYASECHSGARAAANAPHILKQVFHGAFAITLDGRSAEL